jgi:hypothetical protein
MLHGDGVMAEVRLSVDGLLSYVTGGGGGGGVRRKLLHPKAMQAHTEFNA